MLNYKMDKEVTSFTLKAGTTFTFGAEVVELADDTKVLIRRTFTYDAVVETIIASGQAAANAENFPHSETRDGVKYNITYGARGQRIETEQEEAKPTPTKAKPKG